MSLAVTCLDTLAAQAHPEGGWGYAPGQEAQVEPTCLALLALARSPEPYKTVIEQGWTALRRWGAEDGSYPLARGREEAIWPTALVLFVQAALGAPANEMRRTVGRVLAEKGHYLEKEALEAVHDIDLKLVGWPWAKGNFSWTEPTAWACLALRRGGYGNHPRVEEGLRLLLDRAFGTGGVNYGNRLILGRTTEPMPGPTALMLLALQGHGEDPRIAATLGYLKQYALGSDDLELLCWSKIALDVYRERPDVADCLARLDERIHTAYEARAETPWARPAPPREALTALALGGAGSPSPFQLARTDGADEAPAVMLSSLRRRPFSERLRATFRGLAIEAVGRLRPVDPQTSVHIAPVANYEADLADVLRRQYEAFRERVPLAGKRVVLKPNLVEYHRDQVINTNPLVVAAAIELCRRENAAEVIVAEGPGHCRNVEYLVSASGLGDVLRHYRTPFIDLNHDEPVKTPNLGRLTRLEYLYLTRTIVSADVVISLPKLKTHHWAGATLSLKNLFGTLPGICYGWPKNELHWRGIDNSIVDIALTRTPDLAIVDGILGMEGDGPLNGMPKLLGALIMGTDPLAVDATCCRLMQLEPERIAYLVLGQRKRLGLLQAGQIGQIGESIEALAQPFDTVPHFRGLCLSRQAGGGAVGPALESRPTSRPALESRPTSSCKV